MHTVGLLETNEKDTAVTFTWNKGIDRSPTDTITYIFRMDIAGNNFATATTGDTITNFTKSFTVEELNELVGKQWGVTLGKEASLEARVVANVRGEKFVYPEIAITSFNVVTYNYASVPLYLKGTAAPGGSAPLKEQVNGRYYTWKGDLARGNFKFVYSTDNDLPSLNKGDSDNTLVDRTETNQPDTYFEVTRSGLHNMNVDRKNKTIELVRDFYYLFEHVYFVGDAVPAGWNPGSAVELTWNDGLFVYEGPLTGDNSDEAAFNILTTRDWGGYTLRPLTEWAPITDNRLQAVDGGPDLKWKVTTEQSGNYRVTVDLSAMTITFEKLD